jgi:hypothetical protein
MSEVTLPDSMLVESDGLNVETDCMISSSKSIFLRAGLCTAQAVLWMFGGVLKQTAHTISGV